MKEGADRAGKRLDEFGVTGCLEEICQPVSCFDLLEPHRTGAVTGTETQLETTLWRARTSPTYSRKRPTTRNRRSTHRLDRQRREASTRALRRARGRAEGRQGGQRR